MDQYCSYYRAHIKKPEVISFVSILKSFDHLCFDRSYDVEKSIFEFFVPHSQEELFLKLLTSFEHKGIVSAIEKLPNRLQMGEKL
jgi:hypothetical protein